MADYSRFRALLRPGDPVAGQAALPRGGKVAVVQPLPGIGDMIWHLPHIRAIAAAVGAPVTLVTKPGSAADQIFAAEPSVDRVIWLQRGTKGALLGGGPASVLREQKFDAVVLLHHSRTLARAAARAGIPRRFGYGFGLQRLWLNCAPFLPARALPLHPYQQASEWLAAAGVAQLDAEPALAVPQAAVASVRARLGAGAAPVAVGIGSSEPAKQWGAGNFAALLDMLRAAGWGRCCLVGGAAEAALAAEIVGRADGAAPALAIGWPLPEVAALLAGSTFYVGNDTGVANIAAAVGARSFVLFGATPPFDHSARIVPVVPASGVDRVHGMARIAPEDAMRAILFAQNASRAETSQARL
jgi:lipopolysaccharide heptosyltransferase II